MDRLETHRLFFARLVTSSERASEATDRLIRAFSSVPREQFVGPGPWKVFASGGLIETPTADPAFLYQDMLVALAPERRINNGEPSLHAISLAALNVSEGEKIVHIGAGTGYYSAILTELAGKTGTVLAYEIEQDLAQRAATNLSSWKNVSVIQQSGSEGTLPACDVVYVSAGATHPLDTWLEALRPNGRLLFPLTPKEGAGGAPAVGGMLLVTRVGEALYRARFVCSAAFIPCIGARDEATAAKLSEAFARGGLQDVHSLQRDTTPDATCWCSGKGWWLSSVEIT